MLSLSHIEYNHTQSLRQNCFRLGLLYASKSTVRRIYSRIRKCYEVLDTTQAFQVLQDENGEKWFRIYFGKSSDDFEFCVDLPDDFIRNGKTNKIVTRRVKN